MQTIYRVRYKTDDLEVSLDHMWGTLDAITALGAQYAAMDETARLIEAHRLDAAGFHYEQEALAA